MVPGSTAVQADTQQSPAPAAKKTSALYRPELDVLRFFAFLVIFLDHGGGIDVHHGILHNHPILATVLSFINQGGAFGLSTFFFLSAFLITSLLLKERTETGTVHLRKFYMRRILRIWPLYFGFLFFTFALGQVWAPAHYSVKALLAFMFIYGNWYVLATGWMSAVVVFLWSVSVDEQFYLFWPLLLRKLSMNGIRNLCLGLIAASLTVTGVLAFHGYQTLVLWFNTGVQLIFIASGGLMALRYGLEARQKSARKSLLGIGAALLCWLAADACMGISVVSVSPIRVLGIFPLAALGTAIMVWAFLHMPTGWFRPRLVYLGRISYGLYVFHGLTLVLCRTYLKAIIPAHGWLIFSFALALGMAVLSYEYFEKPFLRLKYRFELIHSRSA